MPAEVAVDNDILHKLSCYQLLSEAREALTETGRMGVLGAAKYVVLGLLEHEDSGGSAALATVFKAFLEDVDVLEPTSDELALAIELEEVAGRGGLEG